MPAYPLSSPIAEVPNEIVIYHDGEPVSDSNPLPSSATISGEGLEIDLTGMSTEAKQDIQITSLGAIETAVETLAAAVDTELQVDVVTSALPTGAATSAKQDAEAVLIGAVSETAPASDTASSGLNGRLQRIAQRITALIALIPTALTGSGNFKTAVLEALPAGDNNVGNVDIASIAIPTTFYHGQTTVTTAGTEVALASSQALLSGVTIKAMAGNTGFMYVGKNPVTSTTGFELDAGEQIFIETDNLADVYVDSSVNGEKVCYSAS